MGADAKPTDVAKRLRDAQAKLGLTIQEMADKCGLPKRSLENYMNLKEPQRPGVDALISLADGMGLSLDWIVGRTEVDPASRFTKQDYAFFCNSVVLHLLVRISDAFAKNPAKAIEPGEGRILGHELHEVAALAMLDFMTIVDRQASHSEGTKGYFDRHFESLGRSAKEKTGAASLDDLADRKP